MTDWLCASCISAGRSNKQQSIGAVTLVNGTALCYSCASANNQRGPGSGPTLGPDTGGVREPRRPIRPTPSEPRMRYAPPPPRVDFNLVSSLA
jgi:hypothetical protein